MQNFFYFERFKVEPWHLCDFMVLCKLLINLFFHPGFNAEIRRGKAYTQKSKSRSQLIVVQKALIMLVNASFIYLANTT